MRPLNYSGFTPSAHRVSEGPSVPPAISPLVSLATTMHAQPGVYALLLGSGVSTGAGVPTGWGVVSELVARVAMLEGDGEGADAARIDADAWWRAHGKGELGYSTLLEQLAHTPAARQGLLAEFFEGTTADGEPLVPSRAHHVIAQLVKRGAVRVIVTTNFDRLMEQALEAVGISPQVISRAEAVNGMMPLAHAPATVIKLHGDYKDLGSRNTPSELSEYPAEWINVLSQVFEEYGLVISGWSAEWDNALVHALEVARHRYPLFWDERSARKANAKRLIAARRGVCVPATNADALFTELAENLDALDRMSAAPLTTALAVARLKKYLPDPVRRLDLHDLVMGVVDEVVEGIATQPITGGGADVTGEDLQAVWEERFRSMERLAPLLIEGVWHDIEGHHDQLWQDVVQRLVDVAAAFEPSYNEGYRGARRIPALVALEVISITATKRGREELLPQLTSRVEVVDRYRGTDPQNCVQFLHYLRIANDEWVNVMPRSEQTHFYYPVSHVFLEDTRRYFGDLIGGDDSFQAAFHGFEYRMGLLQSHRGGYRAISGEYVGDWAWLDEVPKAEARFRRDVERNGSDEWIRVLVSDEGTLDDALIAHRATLERYRRY